MFPFRLGPGCYQCLPNPTGLGFFECLASCWLVHQPQLETCAPQIGSFLQVLGWK